MRFNYLEPATVEEAVSLLSKYDGKAKAIAGGTDLLVQIRNKAIKPEYVVDIGYISGLDYINYDEKQGLRIGALTTIRAIEKSDKLRQVYPVISQAAGLLGSVAIRNVATIGGNLCNALPSADTAPPLIGLSARARIAGSGGERLVSLEDFFTGVGSTVLRNDELLVEIEVPVPLPGTRGVYLKYTRSAVDLAVVGVAVIITLEPDEVCRDIKIVLGAVASTPMRAQSAEEIIRGKTIDEAIIDRCAQAASDEAHPRPDSIRASPEEKKEIVRLFITQAIKQIIAK